MRNFRRRGGRRRSLWPPLWPCPASWRLRPGPSPSAFAIRTARSEAIQRPRGARSPSPRAALTVGQPEEPVAAAYVPTAPPPARPSLRFGEAAPLQKQWADDSTSPSSKPTPSGCGWFSSRPASSRWGPRPRKSLGCWSEEEEEQGGEWYIRPGPESGPRHRVKITRPFYLGMYQVTQSGIRKVMGVNPSTLPRSKWMCRRSSPLSGKWRSRTAAAMPARGWLGKDTSRHPVETVNWDEAMEFCRRLSAMPAERSRPAGLSPADRSGVGVCLPCRNDNPLVFGRRRGGLADVAWFGEELGRDDAPGGREKPNAWGLYDMYGNVGQWCADWFSPDYYSNPRRTTPLGPARWFAPVLRGRRASGSPAPLAARRFAPRPARHTHP